MLVDEVMLDKLETAVEELRQINAKLRVANNYLRRLSNGMEPEETETAPSENEKKLMQHIRSMEEENAKLRIMAFDRPRPMYEIIGSDGSNLRFALKVMAIEDCGDNVRIVVALPSWQKKE